MLNEILPRLFASSFIKKNNIFPEINDIVLIENTFSSEVGSIFVTLDNKTYNSSDSNISNF